MPEDKHACCGSCGGQQQKPQPEPDYEKIGLDYLIKLSYSLTDRSEILDYAHKRNLLFSLYSFRCLFDTEPLYSVNPTLLKYGCSFVTESENAKKREHVYEIRDGEKTKYKFDAGSPLWRDAVKRGLIAGENATVPDKLTLFELAYACVTLDTVTVELKAMWFIYFPYVFLIGAPVEYDVYDSLKEVLHTPEVFSAVLRGRYSDNICCAVGELGGEDPFVADWYRPYVEWKCEKNEKGVSRETAKFQRALALGDYRYALRGTEKLLDTFPDDEEILLLNISARSSLAPSADFETRVKLLSDNFKIINAAFERPLKKYAYFLYYRGLTRLGMNEPDHAEADFNAALEIDPSFEPAAMMLKGIENAKKESQNE